MHHIQKHILKVLAHTKWARFRDMRPEKVDSNAYSYHLKVLQKQGYIEKHPKGYRLSPLGLRYVDRVSVEKFELRQQPKIITMLVSCNKEGKVLLWSKRKQPFIGAWSLPNGKMHVSDVSVHSAALREASEKTSLSPTSLRQVGVCMIRALINGELVSYVLANVFIAELNEDHVMHENTLWCDQIERKELQLMPATEQIIQKTLTAEEFFFEEYDIEW